MTILISHPTKSVVVPFNPALAQLFPHAKRLAYEGQDLIALPHGIDETKLLRNMGVEVPAPIIEHYDFPSSDGKRPFDKQVMTAASMTMNPRSYVLNGMGTGKTKAAIWAFDYLQSVGRAQRMLVVAPLSTLNFTWQKEIMLTFPFKTVRVLNGPAAKRKKLLAEPADIYIVNHDGVKVLFKELTLRSDIDVICFDEAAAYRNSRAERSKMARNLATGRKYVWAMTGSPTPTGPTDAYGLMKLINPAAGPRSFTHFRQDTMVQISQFKWVPKKDAADIVSKVLQPAVRYALDDITELPPIIERVQEVDLGARQKAVYNALKEYAGAQLKEGTITAANAGDVFNKMLQASLGYIYVAQQAGRTSVDLDNKDRIDALMDIIDAAERKIIVFSPYKNATAGISKVLEANKIDFAEVTGDTTPAQRTNIFNTFQGTEKYRVLNAHPECMSHGLTLTAADTVIWFGPVTKLETYEQANARIRRVGQAHKQQIIKLVATPVERMIYRRLDQRQDLQTSVLDLLAEITRSE